MKKTTYEDLENIQGLLTDYLQAKLRGEETDIDLSAADLQAVNNLLRQNCVTVKVAKVDPGLKPLEFPTGSLNDHMKDAANGD